jgi:hypothetical protein
MLTSICPLVLPDPITTAVSKTCQGRRPPTGETELIISDGQAADLGDRSE